MTAANWIVFFFKIFFVTLRRRKHHDRCNKGLSFGKSRVE